MSSFNPAHRAMSTSRVFICDKTDHGTDALLSTQTALAVIAATNTSTSSQRIASDAATRFRDMPHSAETHLHAGHYARLVRARSKKYKREVKKDGEKDAISWNRATLEGDEQAVKLQMRSATEPAKKYFTSGRTT